MDFRSTLDSFIKDEKAIIDLLTWVNRRSNASESYGVFAREVYLYIGISLALPSNPSLSVAIDRVVELDFGLDIVDDYSLDLALSLIFVNKQANSFEVSNDQFLKMVSCIEKAIGIARRLRMVPLEVDLSSLVIPQYPQSPNTWRSFAEEIKAIMRKHKEIGRPVTLLGSQGNQLNEYLNATKLLKDCLEIATMSHVTKEEILDSLYLLPK